MDEIRPRIEWAHPHVNGEYRSGAANTHSETFGRGRGSSGRFCRMNGRSRVIHIQLADASGRLVVHWRKPVPSQAGQQSIVERRGTR